MPNENTEKILTVIAQIPKGKVATYGQIAKMAGIPKNARQVGYVLKTITQGQIPWFRVVNSRGEIATRGSGECEAIQKEALLEEKIEFDSNDRISLSTFGWNPEE